MFCPRRAKSNGAPASRINFLPCSLRVMGRSRPEDFSPCRLCTTQVECDSVFSVKHSERRAKLCARGLGLVMAGAGAQMMSHISTSGASSGVFCSQLETRPTQGGGGAQGVGRRSREGSSSDSNFLVGNGRRRAMPQVFTRRADVELVAPRSGKSVAQRLIPSIDRPWPPKKRGKKKRSAFHDVSHHMAGRRVCFQMLHFRVLCQGRFRSAMSGRACGRWSIDDDPDHTCHT